MTHEFDLQRTDYPHDFLLPDATTAAPPERSTHVADVLYGILRCTSDRAASDLRREWQIECDDVIIDSLRGMLVASRSRQWGTVVERLLGNAHGHADVDDGLAGHWVGCSARGVAWASSAVGSLVGVRYVSWLLAQAHLSSLTRLEGLLAADLSCQLDVLDVIARDSQGDEPSARHAIADLQNWLASGDLCPASIPDRDDPVAQVTGAWLGPRRARPEGLSDATLAAGIAGAPLVLELDGLFRRRVITPRHLAQADLLRSDALCIDAASGDHGWLSELGTWTIVT